MKIALYIDLYPGMAPNLICAYASPGTKTKGFKRIKINVTLPDPNEPDDEVEGLVETVENADET